MKKSKKIIITIFLLAIICMSIYTYIYATENVHLGKYKGLTTELTTYKILDGDIETSLKELANQYPNQEKVYSGTIKNEQKVNVDYSYELNNEKKYGTDVDLTVGTANIGFEDQLVGMTVGETSKILVDYSDETENKKITYSVKINYIINETTPEITDRFIRKNTEYNSVKEYKEYLKSEFIKPYEKNAKATAGNKLIQQIINNSRIRNYPKDEVTAYEKNIKAAYQDAANQMNLSFEELLKYMDLTEDEFNQKLEKEANFYVSKKTIVEAIAKKHFIRVSDSEFEKYLSNISNTYSDFSSVEDVQKYITENETEDELRYDALAEKVIDYLLRLNTVEKNEEEIKYQSISVQM